MSDIVDARTRSRMMSGIGSKDTKPELIIRKGLYKKGFRYRLHSSKFPGKPDIVLRKYNALILVNGCFWHGHSCHLFKLPSTRKEFWRNKIDQNRERDEKNIREYRELGWRVLVVWECSLKGKYRFDPDNLIEYISDWIVGDSRYLELAGKMKRFE